MPRNWRIIPGFPDYECSDRGNVRRLTRGRGTWPGRMLTPNLKKDTGYLQVTLNGCFTTSMQRLVCRVWHGPAPSPKHEATHRNGRKTDNRARNLRWLLHKENIAEKEQHGTIRRGRRHHAVKLHAASIRRIRRLVPRGKVKRGVLTALAENYGVTRQAIWLIVRRKNWKHVL